MYAGYDGIAGALYCGPGCAASLEDCTFTGNFGGAVVHDGGNGVIEVNDCRFEGNEFITYREPNDLKYFDSDALTGSIYPLDWLWIYYERVRPNFIDPETVAMMVGFLAQQPTTLEDLWRPRGAGLYVGPNSDRVDIRDTHFHDNVSATDAGALWLESDANIVDCTFGRNTAGNKAGGVLAFCDTGDPNSPALIDVKMERCTFVDNEAAKLVRQEHLAWLIGLPYFAFPWQEARWPGETDKEGLGGGAYLKDVNAELEDCYFLRNKAKNGGALFTVGGRLDMMGGIVRGNHATGASNIDTYLALDLVGHWQISRDGDLSGGRDIGGGIVCVTSDTDLENVSFAENEAGGINGRGGALCFYGNGEQQEVKNCLFTSNSATRAGGAISCETYTQPRISNCTFVENTAESFAGAIFCDWSSDVHVVDSIFQKSNHYAIGEQDTGEATVDYSLFHANADGDYAILDSATGEAEAKVLTDPNESNLTGDPQFVTGPFGPFYLSQIGAGQNTNSPAIDVGSNLAEDASLSLLTTRTDGFGDDGMVDLGFHYPDPNGVPQYTLTARVLGGTGAIEPQSGTYYAGTVVTLTAEPGKAWRVQKWSGTANDAAGEQTFVIMTGDKDVGIWFEQPRVLRAETYQSIQHAIDDANNGDVVMVPTGTHSSESLYIGPDLWIIDKAITLAGPNPDDLDGAAAAIIKNYVVYITSSDVIVEGLTFTAESKIRVLSASPTIRNCRFIDCGLDGWNGSNSTTILDDGTPGTSVQGGALEIVDGGPKVQNCLFSGCYVVAGDGGPGDPGPPPAIGHDGGWGGHAYGGAVYAGFGSSPMFEDCRFEDCFAEGGNGGDGGNGGLGGRGGNWEWSEGSIETGPLTLPYWTWWDGWDYALFGPDGLPELGMGPGLPSEYREYWKYSGYGGAVYCENETSAQFIGCTFENNTSLGGLTGLGGETFPGPERRVPNRRLQLPTYGGTAYACQGSALEFVDCTITGGVADPNLDPNTVPDPANPFDFNEPHDIYVSYGGAVAAETDSLVKFVDSKVETCRATVGGGVYLSASKLEVESTRFIDCNAYHGGGVYSTESTGTIHEATFSGNKAAYAHPGEQFIPDPNDPNFVLVISPYDAGAIFGQGGALFAMSSPLEVKNSAFSGNEASASGGAIYYGGSRLEEAFVPRLHNSLLTGNVAGRDGGAVSANWYAEPAISSCTITDNKVTGAVGDGPGYGGGLYVSYNSSATIVDSVIWGNIGVEGAQVSVGTGFEPGSRPSAVTISHSDIGPRSEPNQMDPIVAIANENIQAKPPTSSGAGGEVLIDRAEIYRRLDQGQQKVKVLVTLAEPVGLRDSLNWSDAASVGQYRMEIATRRASVLTSLQPSEFTSRHNFQNAAVFSGEVSRQGLEKLAKSPLVRHVELVRTYRLMMAQALSLANAKEVRHAYSGKGVAVAIVDTGVDYTHPRLGGGEFPNQKVIGGYDFGDDDPDPMPGGTAAGINPVMAHGTSCAGNAAGDLGTVGDYIGGVAYDAKIYALKIAPDSAGYPPLFEDDAIAAWDWCITHRNDDPQHPIKVISNSWGGFPWTDDPLMGDADSPARTILADTATSLGITILASAGNESVAGFGIGSPAAMSNVISVGALYDTTGVVTSYSNAAENLDVLAPADPIYTTDIVGPAGFDLGDYYPFFNGTSSSCPFVAGCVASIQSAAKEKIGRFLTPWEVKELLIRTGDPVTDTKVAITKPAVNLGAALMSPNGPAIYLAKGCALNGWEAPESRTYAGWDPQLWGVEARVIEEDPLFVSGYYLSQLATDHPAESNCVDGGSDSAEAIGLADMTTRIDGVFDSNSVDMGYHYGQAVPKYDLTVTVLADPNDGNVRGAVEPNEGSYLEGTELVLKSMPDEGYFLDGWYDANDTLLSVRPELDVVMDANQVFRVRFRKPVKLRLRRRQCHPTGGGFGPQRRYTRHRPGPVRWGHRFAGQADSPDEYEAR